MTASGRLRARPAWASSGFAAAQPTWHSAALAAVLAAGRGAVAVAPKRRRALGVSRPARRMRLARADRPRPAPAARGSGPPSAPGSGRGDPAGGHPGHHRRADAVRPGGHGAGGGAGAAVRRGVAPADRHPWPACTPSSKRTAGPVAGGWRRSGRCWRTGSTATTLAPTTGSSGWTACGTGSACRAAKRQYPNPGRRADLPGGSGHRGPTDCRRVGRVRPARPAGPSGPG